MSDPRIHQAAEASRAMTTAERVKIMIANFERSLNYDAPGLYHQAYRLQEDTVEDSTRWRSVKAEIMKLVQEHFGSSQSMQRNVAESVDPLEPPIEGDTES